MTWRSFRNDKGGLPTNVSIAREWNVRSWPTLYLIDHRGIIRSKWKGHPGEKVLDSAVEKLVRTAEAREGEGGQVGGPSAVAESPPHRTRRCTWTVSHPVVAGGALSFPGGGWVD